LNYINTLKLYFLAPFVFLLGILLLFLAQSNSLFFLYPLITIFFCIGVCFQVHSIISMTGRVAVALLLIAILTFFGDVCSTLIAINFDYVQFTQLEANVLLIAVINPEAILGSGIAISSIKLFIHFWIFSAPAAWVGIKYDAEISLSNLYRIKYKDYFKYSRGLKFLIDSIRVLVDGSINQRPELQLQIFIDSKVSIYFWATIFGLVTISNLLAFLSIQASNDLFQNIHRILFIVIIILVLVTDTCSFILSKKIIKKKIFNGAD